MNDQTLGAIAVSFLAVGTVGAAWTLHSLTSADYYCPGTSASMVVPLLAPCQGLNMAVAHTRSGDDAVRISLPALGIKPVPSDPQPTLFAEK